jgi:hypothetical protein
MIGKDWNLNKKKIIIKKLKKKLLKKKNLHEYSNTVCWE